MREHSALVRRDLGATGGEGPDPDQAAEREKDEERVLHHLGV
jgi:hypothetical protein